MEIWEKGRDPCGVGGPFVMFIIRVEEGGVGTGMGLHSGPNNIGTLGSGVLVVSGLIVSSSIGMRSWFFEGGMLPWEMLRVLNS